MNKPLAIWMPTIATGTGAQVYNLALAEGLRSKGHRVDLDVVPHKWQYVPWLAPWRKPSNCDVIVANSWNARTFARHGRPLISIVHHVVADPALSPYKTFAQSWFHRLFVTPMERSGCALADKVIAVSETTASAVKAFLYHDGATVVLNGVDINWFSPPEQRPHRVAGTPVNLLFVGKPSRRKGFRALVDLMTALGSNGKLTVIGGKGESGLDMPDGDYRGRVSKDALRDAYREADFLVLPSVVEGFGYSAAEAMACGTPVICALEGAVAEISQPPFGAIALSGNPRDIAREVVRIAGCTDHNRMRQAARKIAVENLDEMRWIREMEAVILNAARAGAA